ncbi:MAG: radical SAM protein [Deltaproteobacteria bacterium]|nr:radical SAM protein [Deltaproteobacteria bacterium]
MRIDFVNPVYPLSLWDFSLCRDLDGYAYPHAPLSLPTLAALTPPGHVVRLVDENVTPVDLDSDADIVGITGYWIQRARVFELAGHFRARGKRVAIGGPIVERSTIDELMRHADHVFLGEAEHTWPQFLADLAAGRAAALYEQPTLVDMAASPTPRFDLLAPGAYAAATIETSRGCPYACEFCEIPTRLGQRSRTKSVDQVMAEVRLHHRLGATTIFFVDDHFLGNKKRALALLDALAEFVRSIDYRMFFSCQFTINLAKDEELLERLAAANFRRVFVGIETPRRDGLALANKKQNLVVDLVDSVRRLHAHNIIVWAGLIVGFDTDDPAVFDDQLALLDAASIPVAMIGRLQAIPGTPLFARMAREGRVRDESTLAGVRGTYESLVVSNIEPTCMPERELVAGYQRLVAAAYEPEAFARRVVGALLAGRRPLPRARSGVSARHLGVLARLARWYLVTRDGARRRMFLEVVGRVARHRPEQLPTALMHLVIWKHMHTFYGRVAALPVESARAGSGGTGAAA